MENAPCSKIQIVYLPNKIAFAVNDGKYFDTAFYYSMNFSNYLIKQRKCEGVIQENTSYDSFYKSENCYLPGQKENLKKLLRVPDSIFSDSNFPTICDCRLDSIVSPEILEACFKKFQLHLTQIPIAQKDYNIRYNYYLDKCSGKISDSLSLEEYKKIDADYYTHYAQEKNAQNRKKDSINNSGPNVRCSHKIKYFDATGKVRSFYEQCKNYTTHKSGKCSIHQ